MEQIKVHAQKFAEISPIHGFSYIANRARPFDGVFWIVALVVCFSMSINDTVKLIRNYESGQTSVSVTMQSDNALNLSNAAICFGILRSFLNTGINITFNEASFNKSLGNIAGMMSNSSGLLDLSRLPLYDNQTDLFMKATYMALAGIVDYDLGRSPLIPGVFGGSSTIPNATLRAMNLSIDFLRAEGYNTSTLIDQVARYLCRQMEDSIMSNGCLLKYRTQLSAACIDVCSNASLIWFGFSVTSGSQDAICFSLANHVSPIFASAGDSLLLMAAHIERASWMVSQWQTDVLSTAGKQWITTWFDMRGVESALDYRSRDAQLSSIVDEQVIVGVQITSKFFAMNTSVLCSPDSQSTCALRCLIEERISANECFPLAALPLSNEKPPQMPICTTTYTAADTQAYLANSNQSYVNRWDACLTGQCTMQPCETTSYDFKTGSTSTQDRAGTYVELYQSRFVYPTMVEYLVMDFDGFMATFGGILGLWFGGSLISLAHIPFYAGLSFAAFWNKRIEEKKAKGVPASSVLYS